MSNEEKPNKRPIEIAVDMLFARVKTLREDYDWFITLNSTTPSSRPESKRRAKSGMCKVNDELMFLSEILSLVRSETAYSCEEREETNEQA